MPSLKVFLHKKKYVTIPLVLTAQNHFEVAAPIQWLVKGQGLF